MPDADPITVVFGEPFEFTEEELRQKSKEAYIAMSTRALDEIARLRIDGTTAPTPER